MVKTKLNRLSSEHGDYVNFTIVLNDKLEAVIVDNSEYDYKDIVDCGTLSVKQVKLELPK